MPEATAAGERTGLYSQRVTTGLTRLGASHGYEIMTIAVTGEAIVVALVYRQTSSALLLYLASCSP